MIFIRIYFDVIPRIGVPYDHAFVPRNTCQMRSVWRILQVMDYLFNCFYFSLSSKRKELEEGRGRE